MDLGIRHLIYGLIDPTTQELRYVGYSSDVEMRHYKHHCPSELKPKTHKNNWLKSLIKLGHRSELLIIEEWASVEELPDAEIEMIAYLKYIGVELTNGTLGGDGLQKGHKLTPETKQKVSDRMKGENHPMFGKHHTEEARQKMSIGRARRVDKPHSEATKKKMSETKKGKIFTEEHKQNISIAKTGKILGPHSEEWNQKIAIGNTGKVLSEETRKKIGDAQRGRPLSEETKKKISSNSASRKITNDQHPMIVAKFIAGVPAKKLAEEYGVHYNTIYRVLRDGGVPSRYPKRKSANKPI